MAVRSSLGSSKWGRWLLIGFSFLVGLVFMWCGFRISSSREYVAALLAALGANALVVGVGLILLDHFQRAKRRQEWERVMRVVLREARTHLLNIGLAAVISFKLSEGQGQMKLLPKWAEPDTASDGLRMLAAELDVKFEAVRASRGTEDLLISEALKFLAKCDGACEAVEQLQRDISQAEVHSDLIESFAEFGQVSRSIRLHIENMRRGGLPLIAIFLIPRAKGLLNAAGNLYAAILTAPTPPGDVALFKP